MRNPYTINNREVWFSGWTKSLNSRWEKEVGISQNPTNSIHATEVRKRGDHGVERDVPRLAEYRKPSVHPRIPSR